MSNEAMKTFWEGKLDRVKSNLEQNNFQAWVAADLDQARLIFWEQIFKKLNPASVSFGGSLTVQNLGLYAELKEKSELNVIDTYDSSVPREEVVERRRRSLLTDLYLTGTNALTMDGTLVNLDGMGNRVAAITFGPRNVVILVGRNKVVSDLDQAITRIKNYAAPINTIRLNKDTPCTKTMQCEDCKSQDRICNTWTITEKSNPPGRVSVILINQDMGL